METAVSNGRGNAPATLNGYPVIQSEAHANGYVTVMVHRPDNSYHPFVVATWHSGLTAGWVWGHYLDGRGSADRDFRETAERNASRGRA